MFHAASKMLPFAPPDAAGVDWPMSCLVSDVRDALAQIVASGEAGALATLVRAEGPSPRPIGAQMAIGADGAIAGFVSGGCVEANVALLSLETAQSGIPKIAVFGAGSPYFDVRLVCGARIEVFIERIAADDDTIALVLNARDERALLTRVTKANGAVSIAAARPGQEAVTLDESGALTRRYDPPTRLVIVGRDPVALATAQLAALCGLVVVLVCPKGPERAPDLGVSVKYMPMDVGLAFEHLKLDRWTAVVTLTHDLEADNEVLAPALQSDAFYVGALGSRRRLPGRIRLLQDSYVPDRALVKLHAPVGLDIGAASPMEIGVSIVAAVIAAFRKG